MTEHRRLFGLPGGVALPDREAPVPKDRTAPTPGDGSVDATWRVRRGAKALVSSDRRVLLVRERHADGTPFWTLPGGGARRDEPLAHALAREIAEELHCECVIDDPLAAVAYAHRSRTDTVSVYTVFETALLAAPTPVAGEGIERVRWARPASLPPETLPAVRVAVERATL